MSHAAQRTAFVFAGGGSLGAVQVGMLHELMHAGVSADLVLGSSVGAMNAAYFAGSPHVAGVSKLEEVWRRLRYARLPHGRLGAGGLESARHT